MNNATPTPKEVLAGYFDSWRAHDFDRLQSLLADDVTFVGPLGTAKGAESCRAGIEGLSQITTGIDIKKVCADGDDVMTWFELQTTVAPPTPVVNWSRVLDGRITRIRATFDSRVVAPGPTRD